jgi:DMSO/TMAO reductase YedYZ molybdopterin-dependent catalytic subunit
LRKILKVIALVFVVITAYSFINYITVGQVKTEDSSWEQATIIYLDYDELIKMPRSTVYAELNCYSSLVDRGNWTGVNLGLVLEKAGLHPQSGTIVFYASDGYSTRLPLSIVMQEDIIIAYEKDGNPLTEKTRLIVPSANGAEWISRITQIEIVSS